MKAILDKDMRPSGRVCNPGEATQSENRIPMTDDAQEHPLFEHAALPLLKIRLFLSNEPCSMLNKSTFLSIVSPNRPKFAGF